MKDGSNICHQIINRQAVGKPASTDFFNKKVTTSTDSAVRSAGSSSAIIEGKHGRISIIAGADHAHDGGAHRGNGSGALVDFNNAHPVVVILSHKAVSPVYRGCAYVLVDMRAAHAPGCVWGMAQWKE